MLTSYTWGLNLYLHFFDWVAQVLSMWHVTNFLWSMIENRISSGCTGGSCHPPNFNHFCYAFLRHVQHKKVDFLSFHRKGDHIAEDQLRMIPALASKMGVDPTRIEIFNDEADPLKGWWKLRSWRGDMR